MAEILSFPRTRVRSLPSRFAPLPASRASGRRALHGVAARRFMGFDELADKLGLAARERRTVLAKLRLLHDQAGMPAPHSPHSRAGRLLFGAAAIHAGALWDRGAILTWLDNPIGPDGHPGAGAATPMPVDPDAADREIARLADRAAGLCRKSA